MSSACCGLLPNTLHRPSTTTFGLSIETLSWSCGDSYVIWHACTFVCPICAGGASPTLPWNALENSIRRITNGHGAITYIVAIKGCPQPMNSDKCLQKCDTGNHGDLMAIDCPTRLVRKRRRMDRLRPACADTLTTPASRRTIRVGAPIPAKRRFGSIQPAPHPDLLRAWHARAHEAPAGRTPPERNSMETQPRSQPLFSPCRARAPPDSRRGRWPAGAPPLLHRRTDRLR